MCIHCKFTSKTLINLFFKIFFALDFVFLVLDLTIIIELLKNECIWYLGQISSMCVRRVVGCLWRRVWFTMSARIDSSLRLEMIWVVVSVPTPPWQWLWSRLLILRQSGLFLPLTIWPSLCSRYYAYSLELLLKTIEACTYMICLVKCSWKCLPIVGLH